LPGKVVFPVYRIPVVTTTGGSSRAEITGGGKSRCKQTVISAHDVVSKRHGQGERFDLMKNLDGLSFPSPGMKTHLIGAPQL
jgi:hypothetical protein